MAIAVRGTFTNGVIKPLEKVDFREGEEVLIINLPSDSQVDFRYLLSQQEALREVWGDEDDLYGKL